MRRDHHEDGTPSCLPQLAERMLAGAITGLVIAAGFVLRPLLKAKHY
ncbi:MAG TPA: hypothetical protein VIF43_04280 [Patescibacteria group bacterium]|jgi:hypothetical protein